MRLPVLFIMFTVMIDAMGIGLIMPVMPDLMVEVGGGTLGAAALWGGLLSTSFAAMQFLFGPVVGGLSDRFGRRPILLVSLVAMAADYLLMAVAGTIWLLLIGRIIGGITAATHSTANAYIADISKPEDKSANFGLIGAAFGLGFVLGPLIGGLLAEYGTRAPFYAAAVLSGLNALFGWVVLKETVTDAIRRPFSLKRANPFGAFKALSKLPMIGTLLGVYFVYSIAHTVYPAIWSYFGKERFDWDPATIGLSLGLFGIMMAVVQGFLIRPAIKYLGERGTIIYGLFFDILAFGFLSLVTSGTVALFFIPVAALAGIVSPALQGLMSQAVGDDQQGELQGALTSLSALAMIISPMLMTTTFAAFTAETAPFYMPGAPFLLALILTLIAIALFMRHRTSGDATE
ncbi:MAG: TCR/Tet family MFS transporter [Ascidiaceihabitans sp.]|jgi:DHA1 family tetracycline resistance protein-like MFS transporter|nr:TCR/Tet family MFS transporter [Ascidiaceihabitans sp.]